MTELITEGPCDKCGERDRRLCDCTVVERPSLRGRTAAFGSLIEVDHSRPTRRICGWEYGTGRLICTLDPDHEGDHGGEQ